MKHLAFGMVALFLALAGCQEAPEETGKAAGHIAPDPAVAEHEACGPGPRTSCLGAPAHADKAAAHAGHESCGGGEKAGHESCGACGAAVQGREIPDNPVITTDPATGATMTTVGAKLAGAPIVKVADLLAKPNDFAGKTVRIEGNVSGMCGHRRAWFAVASEDRSGAAARVFAAPAFLVPPGSVGKRARTEGVVEVVAGAQNAPPRLVVRATGAEFL